MRTIVTLNRRRGPVQIRNTPLLILPADSFHGPMNVPSNPPKLAATATKSAHRPSQPPAPPHVRTGSATPAPAPPPFARRRSTTPNATPPAVTPKKRKVGSALNDKSNARDGYLVASGSNIVDVGRMEARVERVNLLERNGIRVLANNQTERDEDAVAGAGNSPDEERMEARAERAFAVEGNGIPIPLNEETEIETRTHETSLISIRLQDMLSRLQGSLCNPNDPLINRNERDERMDVILDVLISINEAGNDVQKIKKVLLYKMKILNHDRPFQHALFQVFNACLCLPSQVLRLGIPK